MVYVEDFCFVTCAKTKMKCILNYIGDSWIGKAKHRVEGVIYQYDDSTINIERIRDVPANAIRARIDGSWMSQIHYTLPDYKVRSYKLPCAYTTNTCRKNIC